MKETFPLDMGIVSLVWIRVHAVSWFQRIKPEQFLGYVKHSGALHLVAPILWSASTTDVLTIMTTTEQINVSRAVSAVIFRRG
jgi:hypothetical protein